MTDSAAAPLALYIHWPFCGAKCPYCDFNSHVREAIDQKRWRAALLRELEAGLSGLEDRTLGSIFFGGGTPSLMDPDTVAVLIDRATELLADGGDPEITLEANPTSVEADRFAVYRQAGVNRLSLGVQALDDAALRFLGREHNVAEARAAIELARAHFPCLSFDLIYALRGQSLDDWTEELSQAIDLAADHLSLYQLTIEPGTRFHTRSVLGETLTTDEKTAAALYGATQKCLDALGLLAYEVSNHAQQGAECRHNLAYWRYHDYVGIGPGAHGRETRDGVKWAMVRERLPERWLAAVEATGNALSGAEALSPERQYREVLMMGLRLWEGVPESRLQAAAGCGFEALDSSKLTALVEESYLEPLPDRLQVTPAGRLRLNAALNFLLN